MQVGKDRKWQERVKKRYKNEKHQNEKRSKDEKSVL